MRVPGVLRLGPAVVMLAAVLCATFLFLHAPSARAECVPASSSPCPTPTPTPPTPTPTFAFLSLDVTSGDPNQVISVQGGQFLPNQQVTLYWDQANKVAGYATADGNGNFNTRVKPFPGDAPGVHKLCASVQPNPCANFSLNAPASSPSPSPSPSASPSASPSPDTNGTPTPSPTPVGATLNGFDIISKPPFVFLPIFGGLALGLSLLYWAVSLVRRPRQPAALPSAAVMHRAMRPDYTAGFGTPPPKPAHESTAPSAWDEVMPRTRPPGEPAPEVSPAEAEPPAPQEPPAPGWDAEADTTEWGTGTSADWGYPELAPPEEPPELPEHGDLPEPGE